jgi:hypothetical protein
MVGLSAVVMLALPSAADAHTLTLARARQNLLEFAYGIAFSYDTSQNPVVRCSRSNGSLHSVDCDWEFWRQDAPMLPAMSHCTGRYRVYLVGASGEPHRAVLRPLSCMAA